MLQPELYQSTHRDYPGSFQVMKKKKMMMMATLLSCKEVEWKMVSKLLPPKLLGVVEWYNIMRKYTLAGN